MKPSKVHDKYKLIKLLGIGVFVLASALVIFLVGRAGGDGDDFFAFDSIASDNCIACHTSESVIAASTWGDDVEEAEDTGG